VYNFTTSNVRHGKLSTNKGKQMITDTKNNHSGYNLITSFIEDGVLRMVTPFYNVEVEGGKYFLTGIVKAFDHKFAPILTCTSEKALIAGLYRHFNNISRMLDNGTVVGVFQGGQNGTVLNVRNNFPQTTKINFFSGYKGAPQNEVLDNQFNKIGYNDKLTENNDMKRRYKVLNDKLTVINRYRAKLLINIKPERVPGIKKKIKQLLEEL